MMTTSTESGAALLERLEDGLKAATASTASSMTSSASSPLTIASEVDGSELEDSLSSLKKVKLEANTSGDQCLVVTELTTCNKEKSGSNSTSNNIIQIISSKSSQMKSKIPPPEVSAPKTTTSTSTTTAKLSYFKTDANLKPLISPTKPLLINHSSSLPTAIATISTRTPPSDDSSTISIIPTIATQLIFSSIISTQAKSTTTTTTTTTTALNPSKTAANGIATLHRTTSKGLQNRNVVSPISTNVIVGARPCGTTTATNSTGQLLLASSTAAVSQASASGQVSARLMDMGKRLLEAAREGNTDHVRQLVINSGAPFTSDWLGTTALHLASQHGHTEIAEILLRGGVNRDARTKLERTALHLAAQGGWHEVVDLLLIHGSDVNVRDMLKMTPLHWAVERGHLLVVEKLLFNGADVHARSKFQLTPIDIAQKSHSYEMMELFKNWTYRGDDLGIYSELENNFCESQALLDDVEADYSTPQPPPPPSHLNQHHHHLVDHHNHNHHQNLQHHHNHLSHLSNNQMGTSNAAASTSRAPISDINEPFIDLVELEWNALKLEPDFFLSNDEEGEPKVEYLMKVVEELQKENRQLRQKVEQLSTSP